ncbi:MAG: endopeptidase La [Myxococcales bacterium]
MARFDDADVKQPELPTTLPVLVLDEAVVFPGPVVALAMDEQGVELARAQLSAGQPLIAIASEEAAVEGEEAGAVPAGEDEGPRLRPVGVAARIVQVVKDKDGDTAVVIEGLARIRIGRLVSIEPQLVAEVEAVAPARAPYAPEVEALAIEMKKLSREILSMIEGMPRQVAQNIQSINEPEALGDLLAFRIPADAEAKRRVLEELDLTRRLRLVVAMLGRRREVLQVSNQIDSAVSEEMTRSQREHLLRQRLKAIQSELGELTCEEKDDGKNGAESLGKALSEAGLPPEVDAQVKKELSRLKSLPAQSPEVWVARTWLQWIADLPWQKASADNLDLQNAQDVLDQDHQGLKKVKKRITEYLAVRSLKNDLKGPILCLVGPPGVGKTSLGKSVARAMGRKFVRVSLGGVRDEAEIRGHRRTYVGALPGRLVQAMKRAGTTNPVVMLDEIDKLGQGHMGDPSAALLEVLDPEQNHAFADHYLEVPFDLSRVLFIATANTLETIPSPLRDRMEVLEIPSYTHAEKLAIARTHLLPKQLEANGIGALSLHIDDAALLRIIAGYTREAGVRGLEKRLADVCRAIAVERAAGGLSAAADRFVSEGELERILGHDRFTPEALDRTELPGVATGLAWTPVGGDVLFIEATQMPGKGQVILTGQLGEVMRESAQAALSYIKANAASLGLPDEPLAGKDVHLHVPAGGTPKDGPSAGVTMFTALVSLLTGIRVRGDVAMTGEATLRGRVLPVGGIKEKVLAAHRLGLKRIILPERCRHDLADVPESARKDLEFVFVSRMEEALEAALETSPLRRGVPQLPSGSAPDGALRAAA